MTEGLGFEGIMPPRHWMDSVSALWDSDKLDLLMDNLGLFEDEEGDTSQTDVGPCYEGLEGYAFKVNFELSHL